MSELWNWEEMKNSHWATPADSLYFFLHDWKAKGFLNILDIGAGIGRHSLLFAEHGFLVTSFDVSLSGLKIIKNQAENKNLEINTIQGDMSKINLDDSSFDAIIAYHTIYHTTQDEMPKIINEILRILKEGGEAFITMLSKEDINYSSHTEERITPNVVLKQDGGKGPLVPHYYSDFTEINEMFSHFELISLKKVFEYIGNYELCHFHIHVRKTNK